MVVKTVHCVCPLLETQRIIPNTTRITELELVTFLSKVVVFGIDEYHHRPYVMLKGVVTELQL